MDCKNARLLLEFARPVSSELDASEAEALQNHLTRCPDCSAVAQSARRFDEVVGKAMIAVPIPDGLRTRLLAKLDKQRDQWYRRYLMRRVLPVAAAVLLLVVGGVYWSQSRRAAIDPEEIYQVRDHKYQASIEKVNEWLRQQDKNLEAPPQFDYYRLEHYFLSELEGHTVPTLLFLSAEAPTRSAWVYVLSDKRFNFQQLKAHEGLKTGILHKVEVLPNPNNEHVMYLVIYNSDSLNPFYDKEKNKRPGA